MKMKHVTEMYMTNEKQGSIRVTNATRQGETLTNQITRGTDIERRRWSPLWHDQNVYDRNVTMWMQKPKPKGRGVNRLVEGGRKE